MVRLSILFLSNRVGIWLKNNSLEALNLTIFDALLKGNNMQKENDNQDIFNSQVFKKV